MNHDQSQVRWRLMPAVATQEMCEAVSLRHGHEQTIGQGMYQTYVQSAPHPELKLLTPEEVQRFVHKASSGPELVQMVERAVYANLGIDCSLRRALDTTQIEKLRTALQTNQERAAFDMALKLLAGVAIRDPADA